MHWFRTFIVATLWLLSLTAQAQWQWLDKDGRKVFSDRPPPPDIPTRSILKQPGKSAIMTAPSAAEPAKTTASAPTAASSAAVPATGTLQLGTRDKELEAKKKKAEVEAATKVKAEADRVASVKATNCTKARENQATIDSGVRVSITNAKGEREILDDAGRDAQIKRNRAILEANCN